MKDLSFSKKCMHKYINSVKKEIQQRGDTIVYCYQTPDEKVKGKMSRCIVILFWCVCERQRERCWRGRERDSRID